MSIGKGWEISLDLLKLVDLVLVFALSLLVEWLSHTTFLTTHYDGKNDVAAGLIQTALYTARMAMAYAVMLAVMPFDAGILFAAFGFLVFGSTVFVGDDVGYHVPSDLPPLNC